MDDLSVEVRELGQILLPVPEAQARQLSRLGRPARYGRGEQTLLDRSVRDTWAIPKSRVKIDGRRWNKTLRPMLEHLRGDLGLPEGCKLKAEFHSVLVYGPGQFFAPHQDSEKADAMVGSLVVTLPSSFTGGALVVEHRGETRTYRSSKKSLSLVAFYADCRHQIRPVKSGYRIVLTYNLLAQRDSNPMVSTEAPAGAVEALARCVEEHFTTPLSRQRYVHSPIDRPRRLVCLLDHEYTARGLSWSRLKGSDARRAGSLREAAARSGCDIVLALADVHETWSCYEPDWRRSWYARRRSGRWGDGDYEPDDDDSWTSEDSSELDGYELEELVDWSITLDCWIEPSGVQAEPVATSVGDHEVCAVTPSVDLRPYSSEYEGYMGNYGNTMDRWYRRGALVLWPRQLAFAVHAEASPTWALDSLSKRLRTAGVAEGQAMAATLVPFWNTVVAADSGKGLLIKALRVARALDEPALAAMLLAPFQLEMVVPSSAGPLAALVDRYGEGWARDLIGPWWSRDRWSGSSGTQDRLTWIASLGRLCIALHAAGEPGASAVRLFVADSWAWLRRAVEQRRGLMPPRHRDRALAELGRPILALLESTAVIAATDLRDEAVGFLCGEEDDVLTCLIQVLRAGRGLPSTARTAAGLDAIAHHCAGRLDARLACPPRAVTDWSIDVPGGCTCELCDTLGEFLADPVRRSFEWPLAKDGRRHVHGTLDRAELPVTHQTRRAGRPYTLVLAKTDAIFEREREARRRDEADLAWLAGEWGSRP